MRRQNAIAAFWRARADELAAWTWGMLVNRTDAWGGYRPLEEVGKEYTRRDGTRGKLGSQTTRPLPYRRGREFLTEATLARHFAATGRADIVGLHSTSPENTSRWGGIDIDWHGPASTAPEVNWRAALAWYERLRELGFDPLLTDSNGNGGYHMLTVFDEQVATARVFGFVRWLVRDHASQGLPAPPETFPKQPSVATPGQRGQYGNWLRLPGRHHTRPHWSPVWDGRRWLEGNRAIDHILALRRSPAACIPDAVSSFLPSDRSERTGKSGRAVPAVAVTAVAASQGLDRRVRAYLTRLPNLAEGQGRDDVAYHFAAFLVRDLQLPDAAALPWLVRWDRGNRPPKGEARLCEILANARAYGRNAYGCGLNSAGRSRRRGKVLFSITLGNEVGRPQARPPRIPSRKIHHES